MIEPRRRFNLSSPLTLGFALFLVSLVMILLGAVARDGGALLDAGNFLLPLSLGYLAGVASR